MTGTFKISTASEANQAQYKEHIPTGDGSTTEKTEVESPYTEFQAENKIPYTAKYLGVENVWEDKVMADDIQKIEDYIGNLVNKGELKNDISTVNKKLKSIEKMANIDALEGHGLRLIKLSSFIKYLKHLDGRIKND